MEASKKLSDSVSNLDGNNLFKDGNEEETEDIEIKERIKPEAKTPSAKFKEHLKILNLTESDAFDMIMDIANDGCIKKEINLFKGSLVATFKSSSLIDAHDFLKKVDQAELKSEASTSFFIGLYMLGAILESYRGDSIVGDTIEKRVIYIKEKIPPVFFKTLKFEAAKFSEIIELIGSEGAADFFSQPTP